MMRLNVYDDAARARDERWWNIARALIPTAWVMVVLILVSILLAR